MIKTPDIIDQSPPCKESNLMVDSVRPLCLRCKSEVFQWSPWKDQFGSTIRRYICRNRDCKHVFSDPEDLKIAREFRAQFSKLLPVKNFKSGVGNEQNYQLCVEGTKKLETEQQYKNVVQSEATTNIDLVIEDYKHTIKKEHYLTDLTLSKYVYRLLKLTKEFKVDLFNPDDYKEKLASDPIMSSWTNCNKNSYGKAYANFVKCYLHMEDIKLPFFEYKTPQYVIPPEQHMLALYQELSNQMRVFCFVMMATAARPVEALRLQWKRDIDFHNKTIAINEPAKHGRTRTIDLGGRFNKVLDLLQEWRKEQKLEAERLAALPNYQYHQIDLSKVFTYSKYDAAYHNFKIARRRAAKKTHVDALNDVKFYANRHWRAALERYLEGNEDAVANLLGHNDTRNVKCYAPISVRLFGKHPKVEPMELSEKDPDYSHKMMSALYEGYKEASYNRFTMTHYLTREKLEF